MEVLDKRTGKTEQVLDKTSNSFLITQTKLTDAGINCTQWFTDKEFERQFEVKQSKQ